MRVNIKTGIVVAAAGALAITVPAAAHPSNHPHGSGHAPNPEACEAQNVAYIVSGKLDAAQGAVTVNPDGTVSGTLLVDVSHTNHWARGDKSKSQPVSYTLTNTKVKFDGGTSKILPGERVHLIGKQAVVTNKRCKNAGPTGSPTFRMVVVHPAAS
jgi:hypothetical protein